MNVAEIRAIVNEEKEKTPEKWVERGYLVLEIGSIYRYIHIEWFERALTVGAIQKNVYGQYVPLARQYETEVVVAKRGRHVVTEKRKVLNLDLFNAFYEQYESFRYAKEKEAEERNAAAVQHKF